MSPPPLTSLLTITETETETKTKTKTETKDKDKDKDKAILIPRPSKVRKTATFGIIITCLVGIMSFRFFQEVFMVDPLFGAYGLIATSLVFIAFATRYLGYKDPSSDPISCLTPYSHNVTIIVAAKNEGTDMLRQTIDSALGSVVNAKSKINIILVNDGSTDDTGIIMEEYSARCKVIHFTRNMGKRKAIREALRYTNTNSDIIVLLDSDSIISKDAIARLLSVFDTHPNAGAATAYVRPLNSEHNTLTKMQDVWYHGSFSVLKAMESVFGSVSCCAGSLSAYRKEAIISHIDKWAFDKFLGKEFRPGDDRHLTLIVAQKWKVYYCESACIVTKVPETFGKFLNQQIRWKKSWIRMFCFCAPWYYKKRNMLAAMFYYTQVFMSVMGPFIAAKNLVMIPLLTHNPLSATIYVIGVSFIATIFGLEFRFRNPGSGGRWLYRILLSFLSMGLLTYLLYYAIATIRGSSWLTR
jgi:hyaluronan synthase